MQRRRTVKGEGSESVPLAEKNVQKSLLCFGSIGKRPRGSNCSGMTKQAHPHTSSPYQRTRVLSGWNSCLRGKPIRMGWSSSAEVGSEMLCTQLDCLHSSSACPHSSEHQAVSAHSHREGISHSSLGCGRSLHQGSN